LPRGFSGCLLGCEGRLVDFKDLDAGEFDEGAHEFVLGGSASAEWETTDARVILAEDLVFVGSEESATIGGAGGADEEEGGAVDHGFPVVEEESHFVR